MTAVISFPFERGEFYSVSDLTDFLCTVTEARRSDREFDAALQARSLSWAKVFLEELLPVALLVQQDRLPRDARFRIMPEGNEIDVEVLSADGIVTRFQITLAYPDWDVDSGQSRNPGYVASLERKGINQGIPVFLGGLIDKSPSGEIRSHPFARDNQLDITAFEIGLRQALQKKLAKAWKYKGQVDILLVYASRLRFHLDYTETAPVVTPIIVNELERFGESPFQKIEIIDDDPLGYVEFLIG